MKRTFTTLVSILAAGGSAFAASAVNQDDEPRTIVVTQGGSKSEVVVNPGKTVSFCEAGCFVTMPNGDREALSGAEAIEISGGVAHIR